MKLRLLVLSLAMLSLSGYAIAQNSMSITVDAAQKYFRAGEKPIKNIEVGNTDPEGRDFIVNVKIVERIQDEETGLWGSAPTEDVIIAPKRFILKSGASRKTRLVYNKTLGRSEKVYTVYFMPGVYKEGSPWKNSDAKGVSFGASTVVTSGVLVTTSPAEPKPKIEWKRDGAGITFINKGNTRIDMRKRLSYCYEDDKCISLPGKKISVGGDWRYDIDGAIPLEWSYKVYDEYVGEKLIIPPVE